MLRIVHRDVSPTNILVSFEGQTKIVDFGIARAQDELREESGTRPGKASYMSPEQVRGEPADYRSDIFSLGIILYELTLCQRLYRGAPEVIMRKIVEEKVTPPTAINRDYPPTLELIVMKALEKRPDDRYQSAEEMSHDLEEFLEESGLRSGNRRMAHLHAGAVRARRADVGAGARRRARSPNRGLQTPGGAARATTISEELDLDRRAPLAMRIEVAPEPRRPPPAAARPGPAGKVGAGIARPRGRPAVRAAPRRREIAARAAATAGRSTSRQRATATQNVTRDRGAGWSSPSASRSASRRW